MPTNDTFTVLNPGVGGDDMDETAVTYGSSPTTRKRPRVVLAGDAQQAAIIDPINTAPVGTEYGLPVRQTGTAAVQPVLETTARLSSAPISAASSGDNTLITGVSGQTIRVFRLFLVCTVATTITFKDGSTALSGAIPMNAGGSITLDFESEPWFITSATNNFVMNLGTAGSVAGTIYYTQS